METIKRQANTVNAAVFFSLINKSRNKTKNIYTGEYFLPHKSNNEHCSDVIPPKSSIMLLKKLKYTPFVNNKNKMIISDQKLIFFI